MIEGKIYLMPRSKVDLIVVLCQKNGQIIAIEILPCATEKAQFNCQELFLNLRNPYATKVARIKFGSIGIEQGFYSLTINISASCEDKTGRRQYKLSGEQLKELEWLQLFAHSVKNQPGGVETASMTAISGNPRNGIRLAKKQT